MFILVTARPDMLLPTVRSRCIRLTFATGSRLETDAEARAVAQRVLQQVASATDGARLDGAKELLTKPGERGQRSRSGIAHLRAMASLLRDVEVLATGADQARSRTPTSGRRSSG